MTQGYELQDFFEQKMNFLSFKGKMYKSYLNMHFQKQKI